MKNINNPKDFISMKAIIIGKNNYSNIFINHCYKKEEIVEIIGVYNDCCHCVNDDKIYQDISFENLGVLN